MRSYTFWRDSRALLVSTHRESRKIRSIVPVSRWLARILRSKKLVHGCDILHMRLQDLAFTYFSTQSHTRYNIWCVSRKIRALKNVKILIFPFNYALSMHDTFFLIIFSFTRTRDATQFSILIFISVKIVWDFRSSEDFFSHLSRLAKASATFKKSWEK